MRWLLRIFLLLILLIIATPIALVIALNTETGRDFAATQINKHTGGNIVISGLGGHFPADLKLAAVTMADANGIWLTGSNLELRWQPKALLQHTIHITALTADSLNVTRAPISTTTSKKSSSSPSIPNIHLQLDQLAIKSLGLGAALAGQPVTLAVTGNAQIENPTHGAVNLTANAANGQGNYQLTAALDQQDINTTLHVSEPPDGLLGHYAGPQVHAPLNLDLTLTGPRDNAALNFSSALGAAKLNGAGTLDLDPDTPKADVTLTVPSLAPVGAIARQNLGGSTTLHLVAAQQGHTATISLNGDIALTAAPGPAAKLVGPNGHLALQVSLANNTVSIQTFSLTGAEFNINASGKVAQSGVNLKTHIGLADVAALSPGISGSVTDDGTVTGTAKDFAVNAVITGTIKEKEVPSGPFNITLSAQHLPKTPSGTLKGTGELEGAQLALDAAFTRDADGAATATITNTTWRSIQASADLALASGATLPTGTAHIVIKRLADLSAFSPVPISGSIIADFNHQDAQNFALNLTASKLNLSPSIGPINAKLNANGPLTALAIKLDATVAKLVDAPLHIITSGTLDTSSQSVNLQTLSAAWNTVNLNLRGPASIQTKPGITVHHLAASLNGGSIALDGTLTPSLNLTAAVKNLPASLASLAAPSLNATGTLSATAKIRGSAAAPNGSFTLNAAAIKSLTGPAAALPAINLTAGGTLAGKSATLTAQLDAGTDANLTAKGLVPLNQTGAINLHLSGMTDLELLDAIMAAQGTTLRGIITQNFTVTGTPAAPQANGSIVLASGSVQNVGSGLNLTNMSAQVQAAGKSITLQDFKATAGGGTITGHGTADLGGPNVPVNFVITANNATPVSSDLVTENIDANITLNGALRAAMSLGGSVNIRKANINIPKSLPPAVAYLPILTRGQKPPPPPPPPPNIALNLLIHAHNQIFIRGDGLFAELGGKLTVTGTAANPVPEGGFTLIRGSFALGGKTLQFTKGVVSFNGAGFMPTLDLEASTTTTTNTTATLVIGGTAAKPTITLTSSPPLPSDEVLSQLLFGQGTQNLSPFQAASLAAALASLSGIGGSAVSDPLGGIRNALGLDELSLGGGTSGGAPSLQAGRYVAPGVYVGAQQSTSGSGTEATVEIDLYKGLKLLTETGTSSSGSGNSSSVGLTYQFNY
jgi:translocation and assembly module TamB